MAHECVLIARRMCRQVLIKRATYKLRAHV